MRRRRAPYVVRVVRKSPFSGRWVRAERRFLHAPPVVVAYFDTWAEAMGLPAAEPCS